MASALISVGALSACGGDVSSGEYSAEDTGQQMAEPTKAALEKCYGVAVAQHNDCATKQLNDCAGTADKDYLPDKWKYVAAGSCESQQGSLLAKEREDKDSL